MTVLAVLTIAWAGVLVLALAVSLVAIRIALGRIDRAIGEVREGLVAVRARTAPLPGHFEALRDALAAEPVDAGTRGA